MSTSCPAGICEMMGPKSALPTGTQNCLAS